MVANGTVCAGCCYIAIFRFPAPFLLSPSRNIRHLHYDGTMSLENLSDAFICSGPQTL